MIIAFLISCSSITGLLFRSTIFPDKFLIFSFFLSDFFVLFIALPTLLLSIWLTFRKKMIGLLLCLGVLFFLLSNYIFYIYTKPFDYPMIGYVLIVLFSTYLIAQLLLNIDGQTVRQKLQGSFPEKFSGGILSVFGFLFLLQTLFELISAITNHIPIAESEITSHISDVVVAPALLITGIQLFRRKQLGYVAGLGLLFQMSLYILQFIINMAMNIPIYFASSGLAIYATLAIMGLSFFIPFVLFARGAILVDRSHKNQPTK
jgi:hypothetical protein